MHVVALAGCPRDMDAQAREGIIPSCASLLRPHQILFPVLVPRHMADVSNLRLQQRLSRCHGTGAYDVQGKRVRELHLTSLEKREIRRRCNCGSLLLIGTYRAGGS